MLDLETRQFGLVKGWYSAKFKGYFLLVRPVQGWKVGKNEMEEYELPPQFKGKTSYFSGASSCKVVETQPLKGLYDV